ncbi:MAG TPA: hypothetical protein GX721_09205 [Firmicutes bacterium]|nr:hypothetical protein [Bacillota bacterium]
MKRSLVAVLTLVLVAALAVPALGAELKVSGKYVGEIEYDRTVVNSINAGGETEGIDLLGMSTLYLTLDFAEGETVEGHIPLRLYRFGDFVVDTDPYDSFWAVYRGYPFIISLSNQDEGDYAFSSLGDPLGLGDRIVALEDQYAVLKIAGQPYDVDTNAYVIYTQETITTEDKVVGDAGYKFSDKDIRYALGRATYELADGYTLGLTAGVKHLVKYEDVYYNDKGEDESSLVHCGLDSAEANLARNLSVDVTGPLSVSEAATFTAALALGNTRAVETEEWSKLMKAVEINLKDMAFEGVIVNADMHLVDAGFAAVAPDTRADSASDVVAYNGNLHLYGEALTTVNLFDMDFAIMAYDDFLVNADTSKDKDSYNEIGANVEFQPLEPLTVEVDGYFNKCLGADPYADDFDTQIYGKGTYVFNDMLELWGRGTWGYGRLSDGEVEPAASFKGYGFRIDGGFDATPLEGVTVTGEAAYQFKDYDFKEGEPAAEANCFDASLYAVAEQTLLLSGVEKVDVVAAALAKGDAIGGDEAATKFVGYGHADITIDNRFSDKIALLVGTGDHYAAAIRNKLTYTISENSALGVGCTYRNDKCTVDADYTVKIGESTLEVGYGKSGLASKACKADDDKGKPWAWLCEASTADAKPYLLTLKITVPF